MITMAEKPTYTVLPRKLGGGPHGLGDPNDQSLRHVEKEVLIPKKIRDKSRKEKCAKEVTEFSKCAKEHGLAVAFRCRDVNNVMFKCLEHWFHDEKFIEECTKEYLEERTIYRQTGVGAKDQKKKLPPKSTE